MDFTAADHRHEAVPQAFQRQSVLDHARVDACDSQDVRDSEEVRGGQHVDVEGVALDPFAVVEDAPQPPHLLVEFHPEEALQGVERADLIGHGAYPAYPRHDVDDLLCLPSLEEPLEEPGRFEYVQSNRADLCSVGLNQQGPFAFDPGQRPCVHDDLPTQGPPATS